MVLVDAGLPDQVSAFRDAFQRARASIDGLNRAIVTHHDLDHTGSLKDLIASVPGTVQVLAHEAERAFIQDEALQSKLAKAYADLDDVPEPERPKVLTERSDWASIGEKGRGPRGGALEIYLAKRNLTSGQVFMGQRVYVNMIKEYNRVYGGRRLQ